MCNFAFFELFKAQKYKKIRHIIATAFGNPPFTVSDANNKPAALSLIGQFY